jgi:hypothetical protein
MMSHIGTVKSIDAAGAYVDVPDLGGVIGPLLMVVNFRISDQISAGLVVGDSVLVTDLGAKKDDLAIVGVLKVPTAPISAPGPSTTWPGW